jgi:DNA-directed RNA polymerase subunit RPC12/RpoP
MIRFACPACGAKVAAPEQLAGRKATCKKCGEKIRVPAQPPATAIAAWWKEPGTETANAPAAREIPAPEVLPLFKTPPPTRLLVVIGLLAATLVLGVIGAGAGCYYFMYLPYARKAAPLAPVAAPLRPTIPAALPIQIPAAPTPPAVDADAARKEAERQETARKEAARKEAERQEATRRADARARQIAAREDNPPLTAPIFKVQADIGAYANRCLYFDLVWVNGGVEKYTDGFYKVRIVDDRGESHNGFGDEMLFVCSEKLADVIRENFRADERYLGKIFWVLRQVS